MNAFAAALAVLTADANLGTDAAYRPQGRGPAVAVRVLRSAPDAVTQGFETSVIQATDVVTVALAAIAAPQPGDTITIGADVLTVQHAERDAEGVSWRVLCRR